MNNLEKKDRKYLILRRIREAGYLRGQEKNYKRRICLNDTKKYSFPKRNTNTWNGLKEEVIKAKNVQLKD